MILSYLGGSFSMEKLNTSLEMLREQMNFVPDAIVLDGYPSFKKVSEGQMKELKKLATSVDAELWLAAQSHREGDNCDERGVPDYIAQHEEHLSVIVTLETQSDHVSLAIRKDHANPDVADLQIELDPQTLLLKWR